MHEEGPRAACLVVDVNPWLRRLMVATSPVPPVGFVKRPDAASDQASLVRQQDGRRRFAGLAPEHPARLPAGERPRVDETAIPVLLAGVKIIGAGHGADLDESDIRQVQRIVAAREQEVTTALDEVALLPLQSPQAGDAVGKALGGIARQPRKVAEFEPPDRAIRRGTVKQPGIAEFDEIRDRSRGVQEAVERHGGGRLDEIARRDEDEFAARCQMPETLLDEEQVEVGAPVENAAPDPATRGGRYVLVAHVRRIADDRRERLALRQVEEIHHARPRRRMPWIDLDADRKRKMLQENAVAASRLEHPATVAHQRKHAVDDRRRREHLPEAADVVRRWSRRRRLDCFRRTAHRQRVPQGMTGTVEILFAGAPSISLRLIAR